MVVHNAKYRLGVDISVVNVFLLKLDTATATR